MKKITVIVVFSLLVCFAACAGQDPAIIEAELDMIKYSVEKRLKVASEKFELEGIEAAAKYCENDQGISTRQFGVVHIGCTVCADFYSPKETVRVTGNDIILPVSVYANVNAKDVAQFLNKGYKFRDLTITVFAKQEKDGHIIISKQKDYKKQNPAPAN